MGIVRTKKQPTERDLTSFGVERTKAQARVLSRARSREESYNNNLGNKRRGHNNAVPGFGERLVVVNTEREMAPLPFSPTQTKAQKRVNKREGKRTDHPAHPSRFAKHAYNDISVSFVASILPEKLLSATRCRVD